MIPLKNISLASAVTSLYLIYQQPVYSRLFLLGSFASTWALLFVLWAIYTVFVWPLFLSPLRSLPEPKGNHWLHGQFRRIFDEPSGRPQQDWVAEIPNDGIIRYRSMFNGERVLVNSSKALAEVLVTKNYDFEKPQSFRWSIGRILGVGLLLAEGDEHRMQRKNLLPAFAFRHVKDLYPVFWDKSREGVQVMTEAVLAGKSEQQPAGSQSQSPSQSQSESPEKPPSSPAAAGTVLEIGQWASRITLDIIGVAGLGRDFDSVHHPDNELAKTYQYLFKPTREAQILGLMTQFLPSQLVSRLPVKRNEDVTHAAGVIRATCRDLIRAKKANLARTQSQAGDSEPEKKGGSSASSDVDILSVAIESGAFGDDESLVDQMMTFLAAGHETTATSMTWAVYLLCLHPEVQTRLREEVRERLPSPDSDADADTTKPVTAADVDRMPYLSAVCSEVLRYFAPVALTIRQAAVDTKILGHPIPKGTRVILCPWATNTDRSLWGPDAHEFNPDRWLAGEGGGKAGASGGASSNFAFLTFLHGPRSCIGQGFAKAEFMCLLASFVGRFEFSLANEEEYDLSKVVIKGGITARPAKGLYVKTRVVDGW